MCRRTWREACHYTLRSASQLHMNAGLSKEAFEESDMYRMVGTLFILHLH